MFRNVNQDTLDMIDLKAWVDVEKQKQWQTIVEHPFGTIKHIWVTGFFLIGGINNFTDEV